MGHLGTECLGEQGRAPGRRAARDVVGTCWDIGASPVAVIIFYVLFRMDTPRKALLTRKQLKQLKARREVSSLSPSLLRRRIASNCRTNASQLEKSALHTSTKKLPGNALRWQTRNECLTREIGTARKGLGGEIASCGAGAVGPAHVQSKVCEVCGRS